LKKRLVPLVDAVEVPDRDSRVFELSLDGLDSVKYLHELLATLRESI